LDWIRIIDAAEKALMEDGKNKADLAKVLGVRSQYLSDIRAGKSKNPGSDFTLALINRMGFNPDWLETGEGSVFREQERSLARQDEGPKVALLRQRVSCGAGTDWQDDEDNIEEYIDVFSLIPKLGTGRHYAFKASGSSMLGVGIRNGDYLIFNAEANLVSADGIYVFSLDGELYCKRLEFDRLAQKIKVFSLRVADLEKAELLRMIDLTDSSQLDGFRVFGRVRYWIHPNMEVE